MRLTAKIAPYRAAIAEARQRGLTWPDIGQALGLPPDPLRRAYLHGKKYLAEQRSLPEPQVPAAAPTSRSRADDTESVINKHLIT